MSLGDGFGERQAKANAIAPRFMRSLRVCERVEAARDEIGMHAGTVVGNLDGQQAVWVNAGDDADRVGGPRNG